VIRLESVTFVENILCRQVRFIRDYMSCMLNCFKNPEDYWGTIVLMYYSKDSGFELKRRH
jgi:hypothetical protein